jgi:hypothetical protein
MPHPILLPTGLFFPLVSLKMARVETPAAAGCSFTTLLGMMIQKDCHDRYHVVSTIVKKERSTASELNVSDRFELFLLQDGEKKVVETADTRKLPRLHISG